MNDLLERAQQVGDSIDKRALDERVRLATAPSRTPFPVRRTLGRHPLRWGGAILLSACSTAVGVALVAASVHATPGHRPHAAAAPSVASGTSASSVPGAQTPGAAPAVSPGGRATTDSAVEPSPSAMMPTAGLSANCAPDPHLCGYPDATTTGADPTTPLTAFSGTYYVKTNGTTVTNLAVNGSIEVEANNVTIRNVKATGSSYWVIHLHSGYGGLTVENATISGGAQRGVFDDGGTSIAVLRSDISDVNTGIALVGNNGVAQDNYVHDPAPSATNSINGIVADSSAGETIRHNTVLAGKSGVGAITVGATWRPSTNVVVDGNLVAGAGWTLRGGKATGASGISFTNNRVSRLYFPKGGLYGPETGFDSSEPGNVWSGNVWDDTGAAFGP